MKGYLIPYVDPKKIGGHEDPMLCEFTYGNGNQRGMMLSRLEKGDYLFFHTKNFKRREITAYYYIEEVIKAVHARKNSLLTRKYRNPHLFTDRTDDYIVFGNPIYSQVLSRPLTIKEEYIQKLSSRPKGIDRPWIRLNKEDIDYLLEVIKNDKGTQALHTYLSTPEVQQVLEKDIEDFISSNPSILGNGYQLFKRQQILPSGKRLDLLLQKENNDDELYVVEIKRGVIGKEAYHQLREYQTELMNLYPNKDIRGIIICQDILPLVFSFYEEKVSQNKIRVFLHSWKFNLRRLK